MNRWHGIGPGLLVSRYRARREGRAWAEIGYRKVKGSAVWEKVEPTYRGGRRT